MIKYSKQRELILNAVRKNRVHPTADYIYNLLKEENPGLSLGTVYRNLNLLAGEGIIQKIKIADGPDRFDGETGEHPHMTCTQCSQVIDLPLNCLNDMMRLDQEISKKTGHEINSHRTAFFGVCKDCRMRKN